MAGAMLSWTSPSIPILLTEEYGYSVEETSYLTVISPVTSIFAGFLYAYLIDKIGRKPALLSIVIPQIITLLLKAFSRNLYVFYLARFINGFADACVFSTYVSYCGEVATPKVRGTWGNSMMFMVYFGQLLMNLGGGYLDIQTNALVFLLGPTIFFCLFFWMPESPYYLLMKGRTEEARQALMILRRTTDVDKELYDLQAGVNRQMTESGKWKDLLVTRSNRKALSVGLFLRTAQQLSGIFSFIVYTKTIFQQAGGNLSATESAVVFAATCALSNAVAATVLDKIGRRRAMMISMSGTSIMLLTEAAYFYIHDKRTDIDTSGYEFIPLVCMIFFVIVYSIGVGILPTLIMGELFSASIKGKGLIILNIVFSALIGITTKLFQLLDSYVGLYSAFAFFGCCTVVNTFGAYYLVPDTGGKTLEEIQQQFMKNKKEKEIETINGRMDKDDTRL